LAANPDAADYDAAMDSDAPFSATRTARRVLRLATTGALATITETGAPFASLVTVATTAEGEPILLLSTLAVHTRNLKHDPRASVLLAGPGGETGDPLAGARLTLVGSVAPDREAATRRRFLARHPEASGYADFADFAFHRLAVAGAHLVAGFGRIVDLSRVDLLTDCSAAADLLAAEESAVDHMNADRADAARLYATRLLGEPDAAWRMTGIDPDGADLGAGPLRARLDFIKPVTTAAALRHRLAELARQARGRPPEPR
jgi:heme oxygenase (biliverdin-IX-beta and delta-forming)